MAILFTQADGSDQHYDTYEEFEQAMILMKRLNGEEVPQDLLDEVKSKNGVKEPKPFQVQIDGNNFESAISEATRELAEALDEVPENRRSYVVSPISVNLSNNRQHHKETDLELGGIESKVEVGDKVRIVSSEDGTDMPYHYLNVGSVGKVVGMKQFGGIVVEADGRSQCLLPHHFVKLEPSVKDDNGEGEGDLLPVGTKVRLLSNSICGDLNTGDEGTIMYTDEGCSMDFVYSVRVRSGVDGYGWVRREDVKVVEDE